MFLFNHKNNWFLCDLWGNGYFKHSNPNDTLKDMIKNRDKFEYLNEPVTIELIEKKFKNNNIGGLKMYTNRYRSRIALYKHHLNKIIGKKSTAKTRYRFNKYHYRLVKSNCTKELLYKAYENRRA